MFDNFSRKLQLLFQTAACRYAAARPRRGHQAARGARLTVEGLEERALLDASAIGFIEANLVSDIPGMAATTDPQLLNPWGITASGQSPFWVSDNQTGFSTL